MDRNLYKHDFKGDLNHMLKFIRLEYYNKTLKDMQYYLIYLNTGFLHGHKFLPHLSLAFDRVCNRVSYSFA